VNKRYFAGMGCRSGCTEHTLHELLQHSLRAHSIAIEQVVAIASIDSKNDEPGLRTLAERLDMSLLFFSAEHLQRYADCVSEPTDTVRDAVGTNVAEASALAAAYFSVGMLSMETSGEQRAELIIRKCKNADATFALAAITDPIPADQKP
jgi:cobalt-precorrin 5A hydrolase